MVNLKYLNVEHDLRTRQPEALEQLGNRVQHKHGRAHRNPPALWLRSNEPDIEDGSQESRQFIQVCRRRRSRNVKRAQPHVVELTMILSVVLCHEDLLFRQGSPESPRYLTSLSHRRIEVDAFHVEMHTARLNGFVQLSGHAESPGYLGQQRMRVPSKMEFMKIRLGNNSHFRRFLHQPRRARQFRRPLRQRVAKLLLREFVVRVEVGSAAKLRLRLHQLSFCLIVISALQVIEDQLLPNQGQRGYIFNVLWDQPGSGVKFFVRFIEVFRFLELQGFRKRNFGLLQIRLGWIAYGLARSFGARQQSKILRRVGGPRRCRKYHRGQNWPSPTHAHTPIVTGNPRSPTPPSRTMYLRVNSLERVKLWLLQEKQQSAFRTQPRSGLLIADCEVLSPPNRSPAPVLIPSTETAGWKVNNFGV